MGDRPYTDEAVEVVTEALGTTVFAQTLEDDAHAVLTALAAAGLLVTPRIQRDTEWLGRAYIWRPLGGEPVVLNPVEVDVVLPLEAP